MTTPGGLRGVGAATISIGALTLNEAGSYESSLGLKGGANGDQIAMTKAVVNYLNAHGGIAGRKILLVLHDIPVQDFETDANSAVQAACADFVQDHHVVAVLSIVSDLPENFYGCLAQNHVPVVTADELTTAAFLHRFPGLYQPNAPNYTRLLSDDVDALWNGGWLKPTSKVGVVGDPSPDHMTAVSAGLQPALQRHGLKLVDQFYTTSESDYTTSVLRFKTDGIDRVFIAPGGQVIYFALAAEQDDYHPYYVLNSLDYPNAIQADLPADQLHGAEGIGWNPYSDLDTAHRAGVSTPGEEPCLRALQSAQQDMSAGTTEEIGQWICDNWLFTKEVLTRIAHATDAAFRSAVESLGTQFQSGTTYRTRFGPDLHDGAAAYRLITFNDGCSCFLYSTGLRSLQ